MKDETKQSARPDLTAKANRIVIKLGTAVLMSEGEGISLSRFYSFIEDIARLKNSGKEVLIVTSGAIGLGTQKLALQQKPKLLPQKQACAAIGQVALMSLYADAFSKLNIPIAQVLLTEEDFNNRARYLNLRSTINTLLQLGVVPIFNENDTVSTAEIESRKEGTHVNFGDNDKLSALIASKIEADLLLILTDVQGLFTDNPLTVDQAKIISTVETISPEIEALVFDGKREKAKLGRGGMATKLEAAKIATQSGCTTIVASGKIPGIIASLLRGEEAGTIFLPMEGMKGKQRWIAFATSVRASLVVNQGAKDALILRKASLLAAGLVKISGLYERGDVVSIIDEKGHEFARGIVNYSSSESEKLIGLSSASIDKVVEPEHRNYDALVTRDNLVILDKK